MLQLIIYVAVLDTPVTMTSGNSFTNLTFTQSWGRVSGDGGLPASHLIHPSFDARQEGCTAALGTLNRRSSAEWPAPIIAWSGIETLLGCRSGFGQANILNDKIYDRPRSTRRSARPSRLNTDEHRPTQADQDSPRTNLSRAG